MKKYLYLLLIALLSCALVQAQAPEELKNTTPEQRAKVQTDLMKTKLQLNEEQTAKVGAINLKYAKQMEPVVKSGGGKLAKYRQAKKINEQKEAELKQVLTTEQFETYEAVKETMKEEMKKKVKEKKQL